MEHNNYISYVNLCHIPALPWGLTMEPSATCGRSVGVASTLISKEGVATDVQLPIAGMLGPELVVALLVSI
jgi:hypothetical protein